MPNSIINSYAKKTGKSVSEVERLWNEAKVAAKKQYSKKDFESAAFYSIVTGILKRMLKIN